MIHYISKLNFVFLRMKGDDIRLPKIQKGAHTDQNYNSTSLQLAHADDLGLSVTRRRSCSPTRLGTGAVPVRAGSH
jgi:hypothetical protein